jgi:Flp pilus assembly protein TadD
VARAPEKGKDREPLAILEANLKARQGQWKAALSLYPKDPTEPNRGWVALMRATCLERLGQRDEAKAALLEARDVAGFKNERASLGKQLGL